MSELNCSCLLGKDDTSTRCKYTCGTCGWNPEVVKARNAEIAANGLTMGPDGVCRFIIRKEAQT